MDSFSEKNRRAAGTRDRVALIPTPHSGGIGVTRDVQSSLALLTVRPQVGSAQPLPTSLYLTGTTDGFLLGSGRNSRAPLWTSLNGRAPVFQTDHAGSIPGISSSIRPSQRHVAAASVRKESAAWVGRTASAALTAARADSSLSGNMWP